MPHAPRHHAARRARQRRGEEALEPGHVDQAAVGLRLVAEDLEKPAERRRDATERRQTERVEAHRHRAVERVPHREDLAPFRADRNTCLPSTGSRCRLSSAKVWPAH